MSFSIKTLEFTRKQQKKSQEIERISNHSISLKPQPKPSPRQILQINEKPPKTEEPLDQRSYDANHRGKKKRNLLLLLDQMDSGKCRAEIFQPAADFGEIDRTEGEEEAERGGRRERFDFWSGIERKGRRKGGEVWNLEGFLSSSLFGFLKFNWKYLDGQMRTLVWIQRMREERTIRRMKFIGDEILWVCGRWI